jgi:ribosomal-protein-alanine N-acetyltransferase
MPEAITRPMCFSDIDRLVPIELASFTVPWTRQMLEDELYNGNAYYLVAEYRGQVAGYAGMWKIIDEGHITNIAVDPAFRRLGLASLLLEDLIAYAKAQGIQALTLEVRVSNTPAISLYEGKGFKVEGRRRKYYSDNNEDALIMWLRL